MTSSLPAATAQELERRSRQALGALYATAATDPQFVADNQAVIEDFVPGQGGG